MTLKLDGSRFALKQRTNCHFPLAEGCLWFHVMGSEEGHSQVTKSRLWYSTRRQFDALTTRIDNIARFALGHVVQGCRRKKSRSTCPHALSQDTCPNSMPLLLCSC